MGAGVLVVVALIIAAVLLCARSVIISKTLFSTSKTSISFFQNVFFRGNDEGNFMRVGSGSATTNV